MDGKRNTADLFETDKEIFSMMQNFTPVFLIIYKIRNFFKPGKLDLNLTYKVIGRELVKFFLKL